MIGNERLKDLSRKGIFVFNSHCSEFYASLTFIIFQLLYIRISNMKHQRRVGEALTIVSGIAIAGIGGGLGILSLVAGGLAIMGLGVISFFWR